MGPNKLSEDPTRPAESFQRKWECSGPANCMGWLPTQLTPKKAFSFASLTLQCPRRVSKEHVRGAHTSAVWCGDKVCRSLLSCRDKPWPTAGHRHPTTTTPELSLRGQGGKQGRQSRRLTATHSSRGSFASEHCLQSLLRVINSGGLCRENSGVPGAYWHSESLVHGKQICLIFLSEILPHTP